MTDKNKNTLDKTYGVPFSDHNNLIGVNAHGLKFGKDLSFLLNFKISALVLIKGP